MGVVLNRPSAVTVGEAVPQLEQTVGEDEPVYVGGPVQPGAIVILAEFLDPPPPGCWCSARSASPRPSRPRGARPSDRAPARLRRLRRLGRGTARRRARAGRLDPHSAEPEDVFSELPEELWSAVLTRKGGSYALIARMPLDPSVN